MKGFSSTLTGLTSGFGISRVIKKEIGPPPAPSNLHAVRTEPTKITITWVDNSTSEVYFTLKKKTSVDGIWTTVYTQIGPQTGKGQTGTYTDTIVSQYNSYWYQAFARNDPFGTGPGSNIFGPV